MALRFHRFGQGERDRNDAGVVGLGEDACFFGVDRPKVFGSEQGKGDDRAVDVADMRRDLRDQQRVRFGVLRVELPERDVVDAKVGESGLCFFERAQSTPSESDVAQTARSGELANGFKCDVRGASKNDDALICPQ